MTESKKKNLTVWVDPELLEVADRLAERAGITRAKLLENILDVGIRELMAFEKWGVFRFSLVIRNVKDKLGAFIKELNEDPKQLVDEEEKSRS
jgi:hypothetical protein